MTVNKMTLLEDLLYCLYYMAGTLLSDLHALIHLTFTKPMSYILLLSPIVQMRKRRH